MSDLEEAIKDIASHPGADTRQWISSGLVAADTPDGRSIRFNDENGAPLPHGVLVTVQLYPSDITVSCRVAGGCAGDGEADWMPFVAGDEVIVAIPEGCERSGCVIIGRLNQAKDVFPTKVAGNDTTQNTFGFRRIRVPYILETATGYMIRHAQTGANLTFNQTGDVFLADGNGNGLILNTNLLKLGLGDDTAYLTFDPTTSNATLSVDGELQVSVNGKQPLYHVLTTEAFVNLLQNFMTAIMTLTPGPLVGATDFNPAKQRLYIAAMLAGAVIPGTGMILPPDKLLIDAAYILQSNPVSPYGALASIDPLGMMPGIGQEGFLVG